MIYHTVYLETLEKKILQVLLVSMKKVSKKEMRF